MRRADPAIDMVIETYKKTHGNKLEGLSLRECFKGGMVDVLAGKP